MEGCISSMTVIIGKFSAPGMETVASRAVIEEIGCGGELLDDWWANGRFSALDGRLPLSDNDAKLSGFALLKGFKGYEGMRKEASVSTQKENRTVTFPRCFQKPEIWK